MQSELRETPFSRNHDSCWSNIDQSCRQKHDMQKPEIGEAAECAGNEFPIYTMDSLIKTQFPAFVIEFSHLKYIYTYVNNPDFDYFHEFDYIHL